jgi:hypothetical protein
MAKRPNISSVSSGYQGTVTLNNNFQNISDAFDNTLSLDGSTPNAMAADFDMGSNDIINVDKLYLSGLYIDGQPVSPGTLNYNGVIKETQTATSGQTVFNLTTMVYNPGINSLSVYVDGVYQNPSTYTENNSTRITFSAGLHVGAIVDFVALSINEITGGADATTITYTPSAQSLYGTSVITAKSALDQISNEGTGSSKVGFLQSGTGATNRTVQAKLRDTVSVKDFGAVGDGVTDDTTAVQTALNSGVGAIYIPKGVYVVDAVTAANVYIFGEGTLKKKTATKGQLLTLTGSNVIEGVTFDYDWTNATQTLPYYSNISLRQNQGTAIVRGCKFVRSFARAFYAEGATVTLIGNNFSEGAPHNNQSGGNERVTSYVDIVADLLTDEQFIEINGNTFVGTSLDPNDLHLNPTGIFINAQALDGVRYKSVNIVGNTLLGCSQNAGAGNVTGAIETYNGVENLVVSGNTIRLFSYAGVKIQNSSNFSVTGNIITEGNVPSGAVVAQSFGVITSEKVRSAVTEQKNGSVSGNTISDCQYVGILNSCDNITITGNIVDGVILATLGTAIFNTGSYVTIANNIGRNIEGTFIDSTAANKIKIVGNALVSDTVASPGAISFSGSDIDISHNSFISTIASAGSGVRTNGPASNVRAIGNFVDGYPYGLDFRTTGGAVNNVNISDNQFANISTLAINIASTVTNAYVSMDTFALATATYDPPSLAVGNASPVQTLTVTGAVIGNNVAAAGVRDMLGLYVVAWVSAANTVSWYVLNPTGNPNGTQDLGNTVFNFRVQKMSYA